VATWLAILSRLGPADRSVTSGMTTAFLSAARREDFRCTARIVRLGRRSIYGVAECAARDARLLSHHTVTYTRQPA
jgi:acyl-coenzyme A thioesterase PaaI-like protein